MRCHRHTGGPTKVGCQPEVYEIAELVTEPERGRKKGRRAVSVGGWVGVFGNAEWTSRKLLLVK